MTDITDEDRRSARGWAAMMDKQLAGNPDARAAARVILATIPAPTLADEIRDLPDFTMSGDNSTSDCYERADDVAFCVEEMGRELAEARAEVIRQREIIRKHKERTDRIAGERDEALAIIETADWRHWFRDNQNLIAEVERLRGTHPNVEGTRHGYDIRHDMREDQE